MERLDSEQPTQSAQSGRRAEWVRPEVMSLDAGAAELGDISNDDGPGSFS